MLRCIFQVPPLPVRVFLSTQRGLIALGNALLKTGKWAKEVAANPALLKGKIKKGWEVAKHEFQHYKHGSKLLWADIKLVLPLLKKKTQGTPLTRTESR